MRLRPKVDDLDWEARTGSSLRSRVTPEPLVSYTTAELLKFDLRNRLVMFCPII
jgi:hypothetical protein